MDAELRTVTDPAEARALATRLDTAAAEMQEIHEGPPPPAGWAEAWLDAHFADELGLLLVAESRAGATDLGLLLAGPHTDPLGIERLPMILLLSVDRSVRHRGLARALVNRAQEIFTGRGHDRLTARAPHNDDARISMGERWGFVREWELFERGRA